MCDSKALSSLVSDFSHTRLFSSLLACAQWYFRFYMGRRLTGGEDERQMGRWNGVCGEKGRWKQNLIAKCMRDNKAHDDPTVSPVVRQTLLHWAYELSEADFGHGAQRVKTHGAAYVPIDSLKGVVTGKKKKRSGADEEEEDDGDEGSSSAVMKAEQDEERVKRAEKRRAAATADPATSARPAKRAKQPASEKKEGKKAVKKEVQGSPPRLSEYERKRDEQKKKNQRKLEELGLA